MSYDNGGPWGQNTGKTPNKRPRASGGGGKGKGPINGGGNNNNVGGGGNVPPEFETILSDIQNRMRGAVSGGNNSRKIFYVIGALFLLWVASGFYRVEQGKLGLKLVFGEYTGAPTLPGLNYNFPAPIGQVEIVDVARARRIDIGYRGNSSTQLRDIPEESLMLTGDQNIVDIDFAVFWKVREPEKYLFNIRAQEDTVKLAAESAMREVVGQTAFDQAVTDGRASIETRTLEVLQSILDSYDAGILIETVDMQKSDPPGQVLDSFNDVQRARQDLDRLRNQADAYANTVVPEARGEAEKVLLDAEGRREQLITEADGEAKRFIDVYNSYRRSPVVTQKRMYLETMGKVLSNAEIVIIDKESGGVLPYLPLPALKSRNSNSGN
ncbi:MAG: FtsH protease activity modulator HflK [Alphaproteobacteria bacterium]|nr:FtsH protease activity modulator HflK [Alphaproteobacteria bacterium]